MLRRIVLEPGQRLTEADLARSGGVDAEILGVAARIVDDVRQRGDMAVRELTAQLDKCELEEFRVSEAEIDAAVAQCDAEFLDALTVAAGAIEDFHERQIPQSWFTAQEGGVFLGQKVTPLARVGIYVPGGRARYPSSVLMNAIPAIVAGVEEIAMVVPPAADGSVNPYTLAAAAEAGITEIYKIGGAQAVAALAYGTETVPRVDKVVGPGNAYVTAAKKLVMGDVGIDMLAGPSEVLILADETAVPAFVAIDLMAQAEHDPRAATYLVTTDPDLPDLVEDALAVLVDESPRGDITARSLADNGLVVVCPDIVAALDTSDLIAPEHLEVQMAEPYELLGSIRNAGAIFLGPWTGRVPRHRRRPRYIRSHRARAPRGADGRALRASRLDPKRRRDLPGSLDTGERGRLRRGAQPRTAHRRHGALLESAVGGRLREEVERHRLQLRGARTRGPNGA